MTKTNKKVTSTKKVTSSKVENYGLDKLPTKSAMIRHLHSLGKTRSEIVKIITEFQGKPIIYQHVRNVLITPLKRKTETKK